MCTCTKEMKQLGKYALIKTEIIYKVNETMSEQQQQKQKDRQQLLSLLQIPGETFCNMHPEESDSFCDVLTKYDPAR